MTAITEKEWGPGQKRDWSSITECRCSACKKIKPKEEFHLRSSGLSAGTPSSWCRECKNERNRQDYYNNKEARRKTAKAWRIRADYGITMEDYVAMANEQGGVCAICQVVRVEDFDEIGKALSVDHCHTTGVVRGLLCRGCNLGLGVFKDSIKSLQNAISYLSAKR